MNADPVSFHVVGALGEGRFSPLLASREGPGGLQRRVVLARPRDREVYGEGGPGYALPDDLLTTPEGTWSVWPWVEGADLEEAVEARGPIAAETCARLVAGIEACLAALHASGRAHGALDARAVRVDAEGGLTLVGARGGPEERDREAMDALGAWLEEQVAAEGASWKAWCAAPLPRPALGAHPLSGRRLPRAAPAAPQVPPKARLAAVAALALFLGAGAGASYAQPRALAEVRGPTGAALRLTCPEIEALGPEAVWAAPQAGSCTVTVTEASGMLWSAPLTLTRAGTYRCVVQESALRCFGP